nr:hypothetical protein [Tanacetum cinerariifolium]
MNRNYFEPNYFGFDRIQPLQQFVNHQPQEIPEFIPFIKSKEWIKTKNELYKMMKAYTERMNQKHEQEALLVEKELLAQNQAGQEKEEPPQNSEFCQLIGEMCGTKVYAEQKQNMEDAMLELLEDCRQKELYCMHNDVEDLIDSALNSKLLSINLKSQQPDNSLSMGDEHLSTILETESDEVIKSSIENLVPIPSEFEDFFDNESECDVSVCDDFMTFSNPLFDRNDNFTSSDDDLFSVKEVPKENFKIYSNPLFDDEEIISTKIDSHHFNAESNLLESLLNRDTLIDSSPKFDYLLEEFSGELAHIDPLPPRIKEADFDLKKEIRLVENLLYDNSSPRPSEELNTEIFDMILEFLSPLLFPIKIEIRDIQEWDVPFIHHHWNLRKIKSDFVPMRYEKIRKNTSDSQMEEIDLFLSTDDLMPSGIENNDYDSEGDIHFLEELLSDDPFPLPKNGSSNFDHHDNPSFPRPPPKPHDVEVYFDFEPDTGVLTTKVVKGISEHYVLMPN